MQDYSSENPFAVQKSGEDSKAVAVASNRAMAEIQAQVVLARQFPRDPAVAMETILKECNRITLAEEAEYQYSRGGTDITGPSIRLMEVVARNWGNLSFGTVETERKDGESSMVAYAWDLQTNVRAFQEFKVKHWRDTKTGGYQIKEERDIYEATANQGSRRLRACIQRVIPGDVIDAARNRCQAVIAKALRDDPERTQKMLAKFSEMGVTTEMIEKRIQRKLEAISGQQILDLSRIYTSINDGISVVADWFEVPEQKQEAKPSKTPAKALAAAQRAAGVTQVAQKPQNAPQAQETAMAGKSEPQGSGTSSPTEPAAKEAPSADPVEQVRMVIGNPPKSFDDLPGVKALKEKAAQARQADAPAAAPAQDKELDIF